MSAERRSSVSIVISSGLMPSVEQGLALVGFATQRGLAVEQVARLRTALESEPTHAVLPSQALDDYAELSRIVARKFGSKISGSSLVDSLGVGRHTRGLRITTLIVLAATAISALLSSLFGNIAEPEEGLLFWVFQLQGNFLDFVTPFLWGALGSCVYLLKRYSDFAEERIFDDDVKHGWPTRVLLGAILGGVVQFLYDSTVFTESGLNLDANALGFVAGVGVKLVYGAIEKTIAALSEAMNLDAMKKSKSDKSVLSQFLADQLAKEEDEDVRQVIANLIERLHADDEQNEPA